MNSIIVPYLPGISYKDPLDTLTEIFSSAQLHQLNYEPWPDKGAKPEAEFSIAYGDDAVYLKFMVSEKHYRSVHTNINDPVYEDSCVEFFIGFADDEGYYNFEFNAQGALLVGWGKNRERKHLAPALLNNIKCYSSVSVLDQPLPFKWELITVIPFSVFSEHQIDTLRNVTCRANFYKCGDKLPEPHFLCWNKIEADAPDFHRPEYFGNILFE